MPVSPWLRVIHPALWARTLREPCRSSSPEPRATSEPPSSPACSAAGHAVRGYGRSAARITAPVDDIVEGDAIAGTGLDRALDGVEVAYFLIHSMEGPGNGFADLERQAAEHFAAAAAAAGVRRIVYLGGLVPADGHDLAPPRLAARGRGAAAGRGAGVDRVPRLDRDRRALALVPLPRAAGRADAGARAARLARQPHGAGRRPRHARVPRPRGDRAEASSRAGRGTSAART